jgi:predicted negative regulator of RcsB-dependent stress response
MTQSTSSFDAATENFTDWVREHATQVTIGVAAVAVLVAGGALWRSSSANKAARADAAFFDAQAPLAQGNVPAAQQQLQQVAQRYDGTAGGTQAQLLLAQTYYDQGKYQDGLNVLKQASGAPKLFSGPIKVLTAVGNEGLGQFAQAAKSYEDAASEAHSEAERSQLRADAARAYQAAGDKVSALRIWTDLAKLEGQGVADEARVRVGELSTTVAR